MCLCLVSLFSMVSFCKVPYVLGPVWGVLCIALVIHMIVFKVDVGFLEPIGKEIESILHLTPNCLMFGRVGAEKTVCLTPDLCSPLLVYE